MRWIPPSWTWVWRLKESVLGRRRAVRVHTTFIEYGALTTFERSGLATGQAQWTDTNGLQIWILGKRQLSAFRESIQGRPARLADQISTALDGARGRVAQRIISTTAPEEEMLIMDWLPRV